MHRSWRVLLFIYFNVLVGHSSSVFFLSESLESIQKQRSLIVCKIIEWNIEFPYVFYTIRIRKTFTKKLKTGRFECSAIWNVFNLMGISQEYLKNMSLSFRCEHPQHVALCVEFWWELLIERKCKKPLWISLILSILSDCNSSLIIHYHKEPQEGDTGSWFWSSSEKSL